MENFIVRIVDPVVIIEAGIPLSANHGAGPLLALILEQISQGNKYFVLSLERVDFIDSIGLGVMMMARSKLEGVGGCMRLLSPTKRVQELFQICRMQEAFEIFDDEEVALKSFPASVAA